MQWYKGADNFCEPCRPRHKAETGEMERKIILYKAKAAALKGSR